MQKRFFVLLLAAMSWALLAPAAWIGLIRAQTTLYSGSVAIASHFTPNPRGATYHNHNISLTLTTGNTYTIRTATTVTPNWSTDTFIYLLDPSGTVVGQNDDDFSDPNPSAVTNNFGSYLVYTPTASGTYTLVVTTNSPATNYASVPVTVTYGTAAAANAPTVTSLSETSGSSGAYLYVYGTNFGTATGTVNFGAASAQVLYWSATYVEVYVPSGAGTAAVTVTTSVGTSNAKNFTFLPPSVTSMSPNSGGAGTTIYIYGNGLGTSGTINFGTTAATASYWSATLIEVPAPSGVSQGTVTVTLTSGGTTLTAGSYTFPAPPSSTIIPLTYPANDTRPINAANSHNPRGSSFNANVYSINLTSGQSYQFLLRYTGSTVTWPGDDNFMYILNSSFSMIAEDDDSGYTYQADGYDTGYGASMIGGPSGTSNGNYYGYGGPWSAPYTGTFYIVATTYASGISMSAANITVGPPNQAPPAPASISGVGIPNVKLKLPMKHAEQKSRFAALPNLDFRYLTPSVTGVPRERVRSVMLGRRVG